MKIEGIGIIGDLPPNVTESDLQPLVVEIIGSIPWIQTQGRNTPEVTVERGLVTGGKAYELLFRNPIRTLTITPTHELPKAWQDPETGVWRIPGNVTSTNR